MLRIKAARDQVYPLSFYYPLRLRILTVIQNRFRCDDTWSITRHDSPRSLSLAAAG